MFFWVFFILISVSVLGDVEGGVWLEIWVRQFFILILVLDFLNVYILGIIINMYYFFLFGEKCVNI